MKTVRILICNSAQIYTLKLEMTYIFNFQVENDRANHMSCVSKPKSTNYIDTHCHLDFLFQRSGFTGSFQEYKAANPETFPDSFGGCIAIFCNPQSFPYRKFITCIML